MHLQDNRKYKDNSNDPTGFRIKQNLADYAF